MGTVNIVKWECDRCGVIKDERPRRIGESSQYQVQAFVDYGVAGGSLMVWKEMCDDCNGVVGRQLDAMVDDAHKLRRLIASPAKS